jgi:hypothetical protein
VTGRRRFVLYYRGRQPPPATHRSQIQRIPGVRVLDVESPRLLLVEGKARELRLALSQLKGWTCSVERKYRAAKKTRAR